MNSATDLVSTLVVEVIIISTARLNNLKLWVIFARWHKVTSQ